MTAPRIALALASLLAAVAVIYFLTPGPPPECGAYCQDDCDGCTVYVDGGTCR